MDEVSAPIPVRVIGDVLGVPREDQHLIRTWTDEMSDMGDIKVDFEAGTAHSAKAEKAVGEMFAYLAHMQEIRGVQPADDLVTSLMGAEIDGERLTLRQQRECFFILATAGNDTTRNTTSAGVKALWEYPEQRAALAADSSLLKTAVEEFLRWGSVVTHFRRTATEDTTIGGKEIKAGDWVVMYYGAGNRDPDVFTDPDKLDIRRSPNEHMAFGGGGPHFCLGAPLARLQIRVIVEELLRRYPNYDVVGETPYSPSNFFRGLHRFPVVLEPR
ncbi:cytochrome P450 [Streptomyces sp. NPDC001617]